MTEYNIDVVNAARKCRDISDYDGYVAICELNDVPEELRDQFWNKIIDDWNLPGEDGPDQADPGGDKIGQTDPEEDYSGQNTETAIQKIDRELKEFKGGMKEKVVSSSIAKTMKTFCKNAAFAAAVLDKKKTLPDCVGEIMKGVGSSISDIEVYRKAAKYYFPGATVKFNMEISTGDRITAAESDAGESDGKISAAEPQAVAGKTNKPVQKTKTNSKAVKFQISLFDEG